MSKLRAGYVYVLHFDQKLCHAEHYIGCTAELKDRLTAHAEGRGSNICRVLRERGITWRLGALGLTSLASMRTLERTAKNQKNARRFCNICNGIEAHKIGGTTPYPIEAIKFPTDSVSLARYSRCRQEVTYRFTSAAESPRTMKAILDLMRADRDKLGFIPAGGKQGLQVLHDNGQIAVAEWAGLVIGYVAFTKNDRSVQIQQTVVRDSQRGNGHGRILVNMVAENNPGLMLTAKVRSDLAANGFWHTIGFTVAQVVPHKTSGHKLVHHHRPAGYVSIPSIRSK